MDYILQLDQIKLFSIVTGISEIEIDECLSNRNRTTLNIMRCEQHPSVTFYYSKNKIIMHDFADSRYRGDIIEITGIRLTLNCNTSSGFIKICNWIINKASESSVPKQVGTYSIVNKRPTEIDYVVREYDDDIDGRYWNKYHISKFDLLRERVYPVLSATITKSNEVSTYTYNRYNRCYVIILYPVFYAKLYFIDRNKQSNFPRFITNYPYPIERPDLLVKGELLIIAKSTKCRIVLNNILRILGRDLPELYNRKIVTNSLSSESVVLNDYWFNIISKYDDHIIILDNDDSGIVGADRLTLSGYNTTVITTGYKDLSDTWEYNYTLAIEYIYNLLWERNIVQ